jgi:phage terminase large subunit GpA-like protein
MIKESPSLLDQATGKDDDLKGKFYRLKRMRIKLAGANSPADLASHPIRFLYFDEIDKYPAWSGKEADPLSLGTERTNTFWNKKIVKVSTPTLKTGLINTEYLKSDQRRFWVPCPLCGAYQVLQFSSKFGYTKNKGKLWWPEGASKEEIKDKGLAKYECGHCQGLIDEWTKGRMLSKGVWCPEGCSVDERGRIQGEIPKTKVRGFQINALYSPWLKWAEIAARFLDCKDKPAALMNFVNSVLAQPWVEKTKETKDVHLKARVGLLPVGQVPPQALVLTAGVDVQDKSDFYAIRAWGFFEESWLIRYGEVNNLEDLHRTLMMTKYPGSSNCDMVRLVCMDSGFKTNEVYSFCRTQAEIFRPVKGYEHLSGAPIKVSHLEKDSRGRVIPGGISLWNLDVTYFKDKVNRFIHGEPGSPYEWHLPQGLPEDYFQQMTAEQKTLKRDRKTGKVSEVWELQTEGRPNHVWDCEVYAAAAADMMMVYNWRPEPEVETFRPEQPAGESWIPDLGTGGPDGGSWIPKW